jgi:hypothetical protein
MNTFIIVVTTSLAIASTRVDAASVNDCPQILETLNVSSSTITQNANSYWQHRSNFTNIKGQLKNGVSSTLTVAEQEKRQGNALKSAISKSLASFNNQATRAQFFNCFSEDQLSEIIEPVIKRAKRVRFDKFPNDEDKPTESSVSGVPSRMPNN